MSYKIWSKLYKYKQFNFFERILKKSELFVFFIDARAISRLFFIDMYSFSGLLSVLALINHRFFFDENPIEFQYDFSKALYHLKEDGKYLRHFY